MLNIKIKETKYYNCPYCNRIIPDYAICNCVEIYNKALEDLKFNLEEEKKTYAYNGHSLDIDKWLNDYLESKLD